MTATMSHRTLPSIPASNAKSRIAIGTFGAGIKAAHNYLLNVIWPLDEFTREYGGAAGSGLRLQVCFQIVERCSA